MVCDETWFESDDGTKLKLYRWRPESGADTCVNTLLHIVHGMAEHGKRYERLAEKLAPAGIEVWAADQRGHGRTADLNVNKAGTGGLLGHCADGDSFMRVTSDVHSINREIARTMPGIPLFLLGHSWGSFITQNYIEEYPQADISGCILSGTMGPGGLRIKAGIPAMTLLALMHGQRNGSRLAKAMTDGSYNKYFRPNKTAVDWLSRDANEVDSYVRDSCCGFLCSSGFYRDLVRGLNRIHQPRAMAKINHNLPVYVFSGSADPVGEMGAGPTALVNAYRSLGIKDLEFVLYPGARHETLNETNREEVTENLLSWIQRHSKQIYAN